MHSSRLNKIAILLMLCLITLTAQAQGFFRVGPNDPSNGFPAWYQDDTGLVLALEAAFAAEVPDPATRVAFTRIRAVMDAPFDGTYTITHPYGVEVFPNIQAGPRAIAFTEDVGIVENDFTGALGSRVGPFLVAANGEGGTPKAYYSVPGDTSGDLFIADPAVNETVAGSPFNTNYFEICVDPPANLDGAGNSCIRVNEFAMMGKVRQEPVGSPLTISRAVYSRDAYSAHVDVFADALPGPGAADPVLAMGDAGGTTMSSVVMAGPTTLGEYYGQGQPVAVDSIPDSVIVINTADNPPTSVKRNLVDEVVITQADFDPFTGTITITATSSDHYDTPLLSATGLPGSATGSEPLVAGLGTNPNILSLVDFPVGSVPPARVTVVSEHGGTASRGVSIAGSDLFPLGAPVAVDDAVIIEAGATSTNIDVHNNDVDYDSVPVTIVRNPGAGIVIAENNGSVTYIPDDPNFVGEDTFTYMTSGNGFNSNVATVTVITTVPTGGALPIAMNDGTFTMQVNAQLQIPVADLIVNDLTNGGADFDVTGFTLVGNESGGTATLDELGNNVIFTAGATAGNGSFQYTVTNIDGLTSAPAVVSFDILSNNDVVNIGRARYRNRNGGRWDIDGTATVIGAGNTVTVTLIRTGQVIASNVPIDAAGAWTIQIPSNAPVDAQNGDQVRAVSTAGGDDTLTVEIK